jgi:transposase
VEVKLPNTIEECHRLIGNLLAIIEMMQAETLALKAELDEVKARLNQNSNNSNRPPSSDAFANRKSAIPKHKGKRGGQKGHSGNTLKKVADPDLVIDCQPQSCPCGNSTFDRQAEIADSRQVFDLPEPRLQVVEYRRLTRQCRCGNMVSGKFPESVLGQTQYGSKVQALVALLSVHGCLSYGKIGQLFENLYGYELNEATAQNMVNRSAEKMPMAEIKAALIQSPVVNFDETGMRQGGKLKWLHTASSSLLTYQFVHQKRGGEAMKSAESMLSSFGGIAVHDCWGSYFGFAGMKHAICNAHILRELTGIIETSESKWGLEMKELLLEMYEKSAKGKGILEEMGAYEKRYLAIIGRGEQEEAPPKKLKGRGKWKRTKGRNLLERLSKYREAVLLFGKLEEVPFTNNQAERDLRPVKVKQKVSGGFRSSSGSQSYSQIYSFISTMRKMKRQVFQEMRSVIEGNPFVLFQTCYENKELNFKWRDTKLLSSR